MNKYLYQFILSLSLFLFSNQTIFGQCSEWVVTGGLNAGGNYSSYGVAADDFGNVYTSGFMSDNSTFNGITFNTTVANGGIFFVAKFDSIGNMLWNKPFSVSAYDIPYDISTDGTNVYVSMTFGGEINIDGQIITHPPFNGDGMLVMKINAQGSVEWYRSYLVTQSIPLQNVGTWMPGITNDNAGNVLVTGYIAGKLQFGSTELAVTPTNLSTHREAVVLKIDPNGNEIWGIISTSDTSSSYIYARGWAITTDSNDDIYIGGLYIDSISFGNVSTGSPDFAFTPYIAKINGATGDAFWIKDGEFEGYGRFGNFYGLAVDHEDNIIGTGFIDTTITFDSETLSVKGSSDGMIVKYDPNGNLIFAKSFGSETSGSGEYGTGVDVDIYDNIYLTGVVGDSSYFGNDVVQTYSARDGFIAVLSHEGDFKTFKSIGGNSAGAVSIAGASFDGDEYMYVCGFYNSSALYYDGGNSTATSHSEGIFVWKACMNTVTSTYPTTKDIDVALFPNPNTGNFQLQFSLEKNGEGLIELLSSTGQVVEQRIDTFVAGENIVSFEQLELPDGIYFLNIQIEDRMKTLKVIKQ